MQKTCSTCADCFEVTDTDLAFYDQVSPVFNGQKYNIPPPTHCPDCRQQRRLALCNEHHFYPATCSLCDKRMITEHPPGAEPINYCRECWNSDNWDPTDYGRDIDFTRSFFEQFLELRQASPVQNLCVEGTNINSDYIHYAGFNKNCYLIMHADHCEDCYYGYGFKKVTSCVDGFYNLSSELCYDCIDVHTCYGLKGCQDCINCNSSAFLRDCIGCNHCFMCVGLRNKEYCFENEQLTKEQYEQKISKVDLGSYQQYEAYRTKRNDIEAHHTFKAYHGHNTENSSGDYLVDCKDTNASFDCEDMENGKHCYQVVSGSKNVYDIYQYGLNLSESYECSIAGNDSYHILFSHNIHGSCSDLSYCWFLQHSRNCFGCTNMHNRQYCILNKQYTKEQYEELVPKLIEHMRKTPYRSGDSEIAATSGSWGELFPINHSPFGYNKTTAQMYYPLEKAEAEARGFSWSDYELPDPEADKVISSEQLPDNIKDIPDDILNWAIICEVTKRPFKLTAQEFKFYKEQGIPVPRRSWLQRHLDRFKKRNPRQFWQRECAKCSKEIHTTYSLESPETVYCEECYLAEVY